MVSLTLKSPVVTNADGVRPVNLKTDLAALADLIELAFADSMDSSGRAAIREMRALSHIGAGLQWLAGLDDIRAGIALGYVYVLDGRIVGNVSIYPVAYPRELGQAWAIANVAVHPQVRGRGIARQLMQTSLDAVRKRTRAGRRPLALLQVDYDNEAAQRLYRGVGFVGEREFTHWKRSGSRLPLPLEHAPYITRRRDSEWRAEYDLAARTRPAERGGIGWLRPLHESFFRPSLRRAISDAIAFRSTERLVIRADDERRLRAALWIESGFAASTTTLTLFADPDDLTPGVSADETLIVHAVRRLGDRTTLICDHPSDDERAAALFRRCGFTSQRAWLHMRWDG